MARFRLPRDVVAQLTECGWTVRIARFYGVGGEGRFVRVLVQVTHGAGSSDFECESFPEVIRQLTHRLEVRSAA